MGNGEGHHVRSARIGQNKKRERKKEARKDKRERRGKGHKKIERKRYR